jgi:hypothetical protein
MVYAVYSEHGFVGLFSSMDNIRVLLFNSFPHINFVIFNYTHYNFNENDKIYILFFRNTDYIYHITNSENEAENYKDMLSLINKAYEDPIYFWEINLDNVSDIIFNILLTTNGALRDQKKPTVNNDNNVITY